MSPIPADQWSALVPQIERLAKSVGLQTNATPTVRDQLCAEAVSHVYEASAEFDPCQGRFVAWCQRVLRNRCVDLIRKEAAQRRRFDRYRTDAEREFADALRAERQTVPVASGASDGTLATDPGRLRADLVNLLERHLEPLDRLLLTTYLAALDTCGDDVVDRWCREAGLDHTDDVRMIATLPQKNRKKELAKAIGRELDWVRTRIYRAVEKLKAAGLPGELP